jgi:hypothetical protein
MKRIGFIVFASLLVICAAYMAYQLYFPVMVARSIVNETSSFVPENVKTRLQKIRKPVNDGAQSMVETMHKSGVTMDQILKAIDDAKEDQAYAFLDELNHTKIENTDQVFSMAKKHFPVEFDVESFREPFKAKVSLAQVKKAIHYANIYKRRDEFDAFTAKTIAKRILLQKEEEFKKVSGIN